MEFSIIEFNVATGGFQICKTWSRNAKLHLVVGRDVLSYGLEMIINLVFDE